MKKKILHTLHSDYTFHYDDFIGVWLNGIECSMSKKVYERSQLSISVCVCVCTYIHYTFVHDLFIFVHFVVYVCVCVCSRRCILGSTPANPCAHTYTDIFSLTWARMHAFTGHTYTHSHIVPVAYTAQPKKDRTKENMTMFNLSSMKNPSVLYVNDIRV